MKPTQFIAIFITLIISFGVSGSETHPSLFEVKIGKPFQHSRALENKDTGRPTTQYRVPNYGQTSDIFPEYQVTALNSTDSVSIVTAESASRSIQSCMDKKDSVSKLLKSAFPEHTPTPYDKSNLHTPESVSKSQLSAMV